MRDLLTVQDLEQITGAKQTEKQAEILAKSGFFYWRRLDNSIGICWHHVHHPKQSIANPVEPDYSLM